MVVLIGALAMQAHTLIGDVARCQRWLTSGHEISVIVDSRVTGAHLDTKNHIEMQTSKASLKLHWVTPPHENRGRGEWVYEANYKLLQGYDLGRQERLESKGGLAQLIPNLPEQAQVLLVRNTFAKLAAAFVNLKGWKQSSAGHWRRATKASLVEIDFDPATGALTRFYVKSPAGSTDWTYHYGPYSFVVPPSAKKWARVPAFLVPTILPSYADKEATQIAGRVVTTYDTLKSLHFKITDGAEITELWRYDGAVAARNSQGYWIYRNGLLKADRGDKHYAAMSNASEVVTRLDRVGISAEPLVKDLVARFNFGASIFSTGVTAKKVGHLGGETDGTDVIMVGSDQAKTMVTVDAQGWIRDLSSTLVGQNGHVLAKSEKTFEVLSPEAPPEPWSGKRIMFPRPPKPTRSK